MDYADTASSERGCQTPTQVWAVYSDLFPKSMYRRSGKKEQLHSRETDNQYLLQMVKAKVNSDKSSW